MLEGFVDVTAILRCGVYALLREGAVVYVGQSRKMLARVAAHKSNWGRKSTPSWMPASCRGILFDEVRVLPCRVEDLDAIERAMIDLYKPRYNIRLKSPDFTTVAMTLTVGEVSVPFNHRPPTPAFERRI